jgi:uncharacterized membrane protein YqiK
MSHDKPKDEAPKDEPKKDEPKKDDAPMSELPRSEPSRSRPVPPARSSDLVTTLKHTAISLAIALAVGGAVVVSLWKSFFHYVPPKKVLVITSKTGAELPPGEILAKKGQKGIQEDVLGEGRHFVMPVINEVQLYDAYEIGPNEVGIVTASVGTELPPGKVLADEGEKGRRRKILAPGRHRLNPIAYKVEHKPRTVIRPGYVGFVTALVGNEMPKGQLLAKDGEKGPRAIVLTPGIYS